jgi:hypothetical protein
LTLAGFPNFRALLVSLSLSSKLVFMLRGSADFTHRFEMGDAPGA